MDKRLKDIAKTVLVALGLATPSLIMGSYTVYMINAAIQDSKHRYENFVDGKKITRDRKRNVDWGFTFWEETRIQNKDGTVVLFRANKPFNSLDRVEVYQSNGRRIVCQGEYVGNLDVACKKNIDKEYQDQFQSIDKMVHGIFNTGFGTTEKK